MLCFINLTFISRTGVMLINLEGFILEVVSNYHENVHINTKLETSW